MFNHYYIGNILSQRTSFSGGKLKFQILMFLPTKTCRANLHEWLYINSKTHKYSSFLLFSVLTSISEATLVRQCMDQKFGAFTVNIKSDSIYNATYQYQRGHVQPPSKEEDNTI